MRTSLFIIILKKPDTLGETSRIYFSVIVNYLNRVYDMPRTSAKGAKTGGAGPGLVPNSSRKRGVASEKEKGPGLGRAHEPWMPS